MSTSMTPLLERLLRCASPGDEMDRCRAGTSAQQELEQLCRDLTLLFNATGLGAICPLSSQPHVTRSVLNYGLGNLAGVMLSSIDTQKLESRIREIVLDFEPRILRYSVAVQLLPTISRSASLNFLIEGEIRGLDALHAFRLESAWNTESGEVRVGPYGHLPNHG
ncbi:type VI secretion system baseplate subunit TssE [Pseudomonas sp. MWU13-2100]|uniref:type VI secretion system baseplate subunit TssE n=1 Tax=Pseudomonas sp. MWU13-2100 TaxID=2935075 RepID=UPI00200C888E|nr:GPW/gp25 family protein [Pseudomonas sp. MWU13-2100]